MLKGLHLSAQTSARQHILCNEVKISSLGSTYELIKDLHIAWLALQGRCRSLLAYLHLAYICREA